MHPIASDRQSRNRLLFFTAGILHLLWIIHYRQNEMEKQLHRPLLDKNIARRRNSGYDWGMDDNTYECPNCGAKIYPEQTRCPQCGQNMYPEDEQSVTTDTDQVAPGWLSLLGVTLIGWLIASGVAFLIHAIVAKLMPTVQVNSPGVAALFGASILGTLAGGYVSAGMGKQRPILIGGLIGLLSIPVAVLFATRWVEVTPQLLLNPWVIGVGVLIFLGGMVGGWINQKYAQNPEWKEKWRVRGWEDLLYQDLLRKVRFNGSAAERLIDYERKQDPQASRMNLIQSAIERWERDNR
jgi:hypothetical protein